MYLVVAFGFPSRRRCDRGAAPGFSQNHEVDRRDRRDCRFGALRRGINGQTAPARPRPDEKRLKVRVGGEWMARQRMWPTPATWPIAATMIVAAGRVATVAAAPEGSRAHRRADRPSRQGLIEES